MTSTLHRFQWLALPVILAACSGTAYTGDPDASPPADGASPDGALPPDAGPGLDAAADAAPPIDVYRVPDNQVHESLALGSGPAVIFRYRADGTSTTAGTLSAGVVTTDATRPAPLSLFRYVTLTDQGEGPAQGYLASAGITTQSHGITIQAWFRPHAVDGIGTGDGIAAVAGVGDGAARPAVLQPSCVRDHLDIPGQRLL